MFDSVEPIGGRRDDIHAAVLAYTVAAAAPRGRNSRKPKLKDFRYDWWKPIRQSTPAAMLAFAKGLTEAMGGTVGPNVAEVLASGDRIGPDDGGVGP